jgi:DNA-directed RNA polymerase subunit RPC12/RpoP
MATVNFNCDKCGKLMAVSEDHLGRRVRCPHCQQVIQAPATRVERVLPVPDRPTEPAFLPPEAALSESIFEEAQDGGGDDLFGGTSGPPLVEMPPEPPPTDPTFPSGPLYAAPPLLPPEIADAPTLADQPLPFSLVSTPVTEATATYLPQETPAVPGSELGMAWQSAPASDAASFAQGTPAQPPEGAVDGLGAMRAPSTAVKTRRPSMAVPTLLIFLIPYSIVVTIAAAMLYFQVQNKKDRLELLPDPKPDRKQGGAERLKDRVVNDQPISRRLLVDLGGTIAIGDLEVVAKSVVHVPDGLALKVVLRNTSRDTVFNPVSQDFNTFVREVSDRKKAPRPFTFLEIGKDKVYGGRWYVMPKEGAPFDGRLMPQEEMTAILVTDPKDSDRIRELDQYDGQLVWRIQVRRGLVTYQGKDYSTTGVVGVAFKAKDIPAKEKRLDIEGL